MGADPGRARHVAASELGRRGEELAAAFLERRGYRVLARRFLARRGEVDLVCQRGDELVMVEVKTRSSGAYGTGAAAVGERKRRALESAAAEYRALSGWRGPICFAIVAVGKTGEPELTEDPWA
jgi:putative endonuclease